MSKVTMAHGAGGRAMQRLIRELVLPHISTGHGEVPLSAMDDSAVIEDIVFTTDSHTVKPLFFPGGDIGSLSVAGTVNDLCVMGARPIALSLAMVVEEGMDLGELERIAKSVGETSKKAGVPVITGDTKVVEKGAIDKLVLNTSGIGRRAPELDADLEVAEKYRKVDSRWLEDRNVADGDSIIVSGSVGDHGIAILSAREGYGFEGDVASDVAPLNSMVVKALRVGGIVAMKDPTRGGLASALNEFSEKSGVGIELDEGAIPIKQAVRSACALLGLDPLEIGNEGKAVMAIVPQMAEQVLAALRATPEGKDAAIIGRATKSVRGVAMRTRIGGRRVVEQPIGDPVPRIC
jgi:hydrogenase expression/formation protein HypE